MVTFFYIILSKGYVRIDPIFSKLKSALETATVSPNNLEESKGKTN
jgi:hypothetical protein